MKKFLLTSILAFIAALVFSQERIAVFPFEDMDNVLTRNEAAMFYRTFSDEFTNRSEDRFSVVPQHEIERFINTETAFQLGEFFTRVKTAEMNRVLNETQILSGVIGRIGNNIRITVYLYTYPELVQLLGMTTISIANKDELFRRIPELVQNIQNAITSVIESDGTTTVPANFVLIQGGTFTMGSPYNEPSRSVNETQHQVRITSFYMGIYEVTQREYQEVMGTNPSNFKGNNLPVELVSWYDAIEYCNRRSEREGLTPVYTIDKSRRDPNNSSRIDTFRWLITWNRNANGYRLPTEAELEYACRAGTITPFNTGNNIPTSMANYDGRNPYNNSSRGTYRARTTAVGSFAPNPWGLYDMHGNVYEWCWDWFGNYSAGAQTDPRGDVSGYERVYRGGSWYSFGPILRSAFRNCTDPSDRGHSIGFRVVRNAQ